MLTPSMSEHSLRSISGHVNIGDVPSGSEDPRQIRLRLRELYRHPTVRGTVASIGATDEHVRK
ncbi:hypothetical protein GCM10010234_17240 [Streptomyces hawaiiensis]